MRVPASSQARCSTSRAYSQCFPHILELFGRLCSFSARVGSSTPSLLQPWLVRPAPAVLRDVELDLPRTLLRCVRSAPEPVCEATSA